MINSPDLLTSEAGRAHAAERYQVLKRERGAALALQLAPIVTDGRSVIWEIGCGHGHFLTAYARAHPGQICLGNDIASDRIARAQRKRDRARLANLHFIRAEAGLFLDVLPLSVRLAEVFVLFPDPWPKLRHHKHRLMQPHFLARLAGRMDPGARLHFRTDYRPYFDETACLLHQVPGWRICDEPWEFEHETVFQRRATDYWSLIAQSRGPAS